jgi:hypothetical protein
MSFSIIYTKTDRGNDEVRQRTDSISPLARRVLIMVDGKRTEDELRWVVRDGQLDHVLAELRAHGLIEECGLAELAEREWTDDDATVVEASPLRFDLGLSAPARSASAAPPPPTLRIAVEPAAQRTAAPVGPAAASAAATLERPRPRAAPAATQAASVAAAPAAICLEDAKRAAVRALFERLGPYGEEPATRIQECKSIEALREQVKHACKRITTFRGEPAAREYLAAIGLQ